MADNTLVSQEMAQEASNEVGLSLEWMGFFLVPILLKQKVTSFFLSVFMVILALMCYYGNYKSLHMAFGYYLANMWWKIVKNWKVQLQASVGCGLGKMEQERHNIIWNYTPYRSVSLGTLISHCWNAQTVPTMVKIR